MSRTGIANLPLHGGKAPRWLFKRMVHLSKSITDAIVYEYGHEEFLKRISDPFWFQALSCVLGYDWHSSGTTTVTCGALKEAINPEEYGFAICGGKGKTSRKTPEEITKIGDIYNLSCDKIEKLKYSSRMSAKVDNSAIQDGHNLYHHVFLFTEGGKWVVIQQGMNNETNYARRYHWFSNDFKKFTIDPHKSIRGERNLCRVLDMVSKDSQNTQKTSVDLVKENPVHLKEDWARLTKHTSQTTLYDWNNSTYEEIKHLDMPRSINWNKMKEIYDFQPKNYEEFLSFKGVGPNTIRALSLISDLIYGDKPSWQDPVKYSFTVGGKDGVPFPVDRKAMDESTEIIKNGINQAKVGNKEKIHAIKRLKKFCYAN
jgi:hypothetical protein